MESPRLSSLEHSRWGNLPGGDITKGQACPAVCSRSVHPQHCAFLSTDQPAPASSASIQYGVFTPTNTPKTVGLYPRRSPFHKLVQGGSCWVEPQTTQLGQTGRTSVNGSAPFLEPSSSISCSLASVHLGVSMRVTLVLLYAGGVLGTHLSRGRCIQSGWGHVRNSVKQSRL